MKQKRVVFALIFIFTMLYQSIVWAEVDIVLNGSFSDWEDKPALLDEVGDESSGRDIEEVKWYPDNTKGYLYFYARRSNSGNMDWNYSVYLAGDLGERRADINYKRSNTTITVNLYNAYNTRLWYTSGRWGDFKNPGTKTEFYIPLSQLVSTPEAGYELAATFQSRNDIIPDDGAITISSVSTGPIIIVLGVVLANVLLAVYIRKKKVRA
jgi:hypothetical protein